MKVGILTYHSAHNYGAMLQAYALQTTLTNLGLEATVINFHPKYVERKNRRKQKKSRSLSTWLTSIVTFLLRSKFNRRYENFDSFMNRHLRLTKRYYKDSELEADLPKLDALVFGSDQIWNMENGGDPVFFAQFVPANTLKVAYAPSFSRDTIPDKYKPKLKSWLSAFDQLSVRESSGIDIIREATGHPAIQVIDPVFLLPAYHWHSIAKSSGYQGDYLLFYSLEVSAALSDLVTVISKRLGLPVVILGKGGGFILKCKTKIAIDSGPAEFLGWFENASFIITNSFHATAFAIIYKKPFFVFPHATRNTRMESLLKLTDLESRQIKDLEKATQMTRTELLDVDFSVAEQHIEKQKKESLSFLEQALV